MHNHTNIPSLTIDGGPIETMPNTMDDKAPDELLEVANEQAVVATIVGHASLGLTRRQTIRRYWKVSSVTKQLFFELTISGCHVLLDGLFRRLFRWLPPYSSR